MVPTFASHLSVATAGRLLVTAPLYAVGLGIMVMSMSVRAIMMMAMIVFLGFIFLAPLMGGGFRYDLPVILPQSVIRGAAVVFMFLGGLAGANSMWQAIVGGLRAGPAAMVAGSRRPDPDHAAEQQAEGTVTRFCEQEDLSIPEIRVLEADRPLCYTVRYSLKAPPEEIMEEYFDVYEVWAEEQENDDGETPADEEFLADYVLVVSTGLLQTLPDDELAAVLAHEVAHLRHGDLALMNVLLLPVYWGDAVLAWGDTDESNGSYILRLMGPVASAALNVTLLGVAVFTRGREFAADRGGAELAGDPAVLASALERLDRSTGGQFERNLRSVVVANVLPPAGRSWRGLLAVHPPTQRRIERLRSTGTQS